MDRLERMIARLLTQRACILHAAGLIHELPGPVLEIGLGKGRTYSHLTRIFPERPIFAFDRDVHAPAGSIPDADRLILGDFRQTLPNALQRTGRPAALAHADIGTESRSADDDLAQFVGGQMASLVGRGGLVLTDREMRSGDLEPLPLPAVSLPDGIEAWPYFLYRRRLD